MFVSSILRSAKQTSDMSVLLDQLAQVSTRPRYAFMLLSLIAEVADQKGQAGPYIAVANDRVMLRDWLCDALTPMGRRDPKRQARAERVRDELAGKGLLPTDPALAHALIEDEVHERVRASGKTNLSRAVTELVNANLLKRHYHGYSVDHLNRGAQRPAVYTLAGRSRCLLARKASPSRSAGWQGELPLH